MTGIRLPLLNFLEWSFGPHASYLLRVGQLIQSGDPRASSGSGSARYSSRRRCRGDLLRGERPVGLGLVGTQAVVAYVARHCNQLSSQLMLLHVHVFPPGERRGALSATRSLHVLQEQAPDAFRVGSHGIRIKRVVVFERTVTSYLPGRRSE